jgi:membrane protein DedA with SNARE-associated domain
LKCSRPHSGGQRAPDASHWVERRSRDTALHLIDILRAPYDLANWATDEVFLILNALFTRYGVPIVFLAALSESTVGLGLVVPGIIMIFLAGAYAHEQQTSISLMFFVATVGTVLGDTLSYGLGRWGGERLRGTRLRPALRMGEALVRGQARWFIPFYHLNSVSRTLGPFGAGALRMPLRMWIPLDYAGAIIANVVYMGAGVVFGRALLTDHGTLREHPALRIGFFVAAFVWLFLVRREFLKMRAEQSEAAAARAAALAATVSPVLPPPGE